MSDSELVTAEVIAEQFGVTVQTVNDWVRRGRIPCIRPSRKVVRFRLDDVERAIEQPAVGERGER